MFNFEFKIDTAAAMAASTGGGIVSTGIYDIQNIGLFVEMDKKGNPRCEISLLGTGGEKIRIYNMMIAKTWAGKNTDNFDYDKFNAFALIGKVRNGTTTIEDTTKKGSTKRLSLNFEPNHKFKVAVYREYDAFGSMGVVKERDGLRLGATFLATGQSISEAQNNAEAIEITTVKSTDNYTKRWNQLVE